MATFPTPPDGSVTTAKLVDGAVTAAKVAADVATQAELNAEAAAREAADAALAASVGSGDAVDIDFTPAGTIAATNVQAAVEEVATDAASALSTGLASKQDAATAATDAELTAGLATKANASHTHAQADVTDLSSDLALKAPLASPALTGNPTAPTATVGDDDTSIATTAFVQAAAALLIPKSLADAKGDLLVATADNTVGRLAAGTNDHVLTADSAQATGLKWAAAAGGGGGPFIAKVKTGSSFYHVAAAGLSSGVVIALGTGSTAMRSTAFLIDRACTLSSLSIFVTTAVASSTVRLGIYADDGAGRPGSLVLDAGTVATDTTGFKELAITQALTAGLYWFGVAQQGGASPISTQAVASGSNGLWNVKSTSSGDAGNMLTFGYTGYKMSGTVAGALPSTWTFPSDPMSGSTSVAFKVT